MSRRSVYNDQGTRENLRQETPLENLNQNLQDKKQFAQQKLRYYWISVREWILTNRKVILFSLIALVPLYLMLFPFSKKVVENVTPNINKNDVKTKVGDYWYKGKENAKESLDKTRRYVNEKKEDVEDKLGKTKSKSERLWRKNKNDVKDTWQEVKDYTQEKVQDVENKAKRAFRRTGLNEKMKDAKDYIYGKTEDVKEYLQEKKEEVKDKMNDAKEYINKKTNIGKKLEDTKDYINEKTGIGEKLEDAKDYINKKTNIGEKLEDAKDYINKKTGDVKDMVKEKLDQASDYLSGDEEDSDYDPEDHVIETLDDKPIPPIV